MSGLKNLFFGLWTYMEIQCLGVRGMEKMKKCKICGSEDMDDYGCLKCLIRYANHSALKRIEEKEDEV